VSQSLRSAQLWMLDHPQQVFAGGKPAGSRAGFSFKRKSKPRNDDRGAVNRLPPKYWAAFSVSGSID